MIICNLEMIDKLIDEEFLRPKIDDRSAAIQRKVAAKKINRDFLAEFYLEQVAAENGKV